MLSCTRLRVTRILARPAHTLEANPSETGKFRNVVPKAVEEFLKGHQQAAWENQI